GAGGREPLVDQDEVVAQEAELELRVGEDEAPAARQLGSELVELQACIAQLRRQLVAELLFQLRKADVLVVAALGFGGRREDRIGKALALTQTGRHLIAG